MKKATARLLMIGSLGAAGCAEMSPALTEAVVNLGREFIGQTAANYAPDYAQSVNQLLLTMAEITTGAPFASAPGGYQAHTVYDDPNYGQSSQGSGYDQGYGNQGYDQGYENPGYDPMAGDTGYDPMAAEPGYDPMTGDGSYDPMVAGNQGYDQSGYDPMAGGYQAQPETGNAYPEPGAGSYGSADSYGGYGEPVGYTPANQPLHLTADLLAQSFTPDGRVVLRPISDGDILTDGRGNPAAGDKIKLRFQANCSCYLYIIGVDATGWVTQILPEAGKIVRPLAANQTYLIPDGDEWWGLDEYRGVEHIYFVLSQARRPDLEQALAALPTERPSPGSGYAAVQEPTLLVTRGLVKVRDQAPEATNTPASLNQVTRTTFSSEMLTGDLVVTRWFQHQ